MVISAGFFLWHFHSPMYLQVHITAYLLHELHAVYAVYILRSALRGNAVRSVCNYITSLRSVGTWMHLTASECQLQISLAMQRNRCTRHLGHKSLGWEKLLPRVPFSDFPFIWPPLIILYCSLHYAHELHVNTQLHTQSIVRNHCEGDNQESQTPQPFVTSLLPTWSKKL